MRSGFFNDVDGDRLYDARFFAEYFASFIGNGIFANPSTSLQVYSNEGMTTKIAAGKGWINGFFVVNDEDFTIQHDIADGVLKRIDRIVLQLNHAERKIEAKVKKGTPSSKPVAPSIQRDADYYELVLADVQIVNGVTNILQSDITDQRFNSSLCGVVKGLINEIDTTDLFAQYNDEFQRWFAELQEQLDGDVAANLQRQITDHNNSPTPHLMVDDVTGTRYKYGVGISNNEFNITRDNEEVTEKFPIALKNDLRKAERELKHEVANLNLQLEASQRVKNGKTFGTDFNAAFSMEIDTARTSCDTALAIGTTEITVKDASEFTAGTEVTIYDDVNLERLNIASISGNVIMLEQATSKPYKEGVNIARSMSVQNAVTKELSFGVWGSYKYLIYNLSGIALGSYNNEDSNRNGMVFVKDTWFVLTKQTNSSIVSLYKMRIDESTFTATSLTFNFDGNNMQRTSAPDLFVINDYLVIVQRDKIQVYDSSLVLMSEYLFTVTYNNKIVHFDNRNNRILYFVGGTTLTLAEFTVDSKGVINMHSDFVTLITTASNVQWYASSNTPIIAHSNGEISLVISKYTYTDSSISSVESRLLLISSNKNIVSNTLLFSLTGSTYFGNGLAYEHEGTAYYYLSHGMNGLSIIETQDFISFTRTQITDSTIRPDNAFDLIFGINANKSIFIRNYNRNIVIKFTVASKNYETIFTGGTKSSNRRTEGFYVDKSSTDDNAWFLLRNDTTTNTGTNHLFVGSGVLGYGNLLTINDVRFKVPATKEVATWLQHDTDLTVAEAKFGTLPMQKETIDGETQFTAVSAVNEHDEIRFTITRPTVDDDVNINKILGGIG